MAKQLNLDELLECLGRIDPDLGAKYQARLESLGSEMALLIGDKLKIVAGYASFEGTAFSGTCVPFYPAVEGQHCPAPLSDYDANEWDGPAPSYEKLAEQAVNARLNFKIAFPDRPKLDN